MSDIYEELDLEAYDVGEYEEEEDFDHILRAKWVMDGANSLSEAVAQLRAYADWIEELESSGWQLTITPIDDDYAFLAKFDENGDKIKEATLG